MSSRRSTGQSVTSDDEYYEEVIDNEEEYYDDIILEGSDAEKNDFDDYTSDYTEVTLEDDDDNGCDQEADQVNEALDAIERQSKDERDKLDQETRKSPRGADKYKDDEEKSRVQAKINARREAARNMLAKANSALRGEIDPPPPIFQVAARNINDPEKEREEAAKILDEANEFYSIEQLKQQSIPGLDYKNREKYLSNSDFEAAFKCNKSEWANMPTWKKTKAKRALGLF
jgi:hypothetical protein